MTHGRTTNTNNHPADKEDGPSAPYPSAADASEAEVDEAVELIERMDTGRLPAPHAPAPGATAELLALGSPERCAVS